ARHSRSPPGAPGTPPSPAATAHPARRGPTTPARRPDAVRMAEDVATVRHDIFTEDALAWAYYKTGRIQEALGASERALRTGARDPRILSHAAEIRRAAGRSRAKSS